MTTLMQAHRQWMSRAPDERFTSLIEMQDLKNLGRFEGSGKWRRHGTSSNKPPTAISHPVEPARWLRIARRVDDPKQGLVQRLRQNPDALKDPKIPVLAYR